MVLLTFGSFYPPFSMNERFLVPGVYWSKYQLGRIPTSESTSRGGWNTTFTFQVEKFYSRAHDSKNSEIEAVLLLCRVCAHSYKTGRILWTLYPTCFSTWETLRTLGRLFTEEILSALYYECMMCCILYVVVQQSHLGHLGHSVFW